ncbi:MAG: hypothetical protein QF473_33125 [Planctomycetota bacterium]|jgi:hypothetical protein|nr:hypothetical protein [Planctomycetota bacterium]
MTMVLQAVPSQDYLASGIISGGEPSFNVAHPDQGPVAPQVDIWGTGIEDELDEIQKKTAARLDSSINELMARMEREVMALAKQRVQEFLEETGWQTSKQTVDESDSTSTTELDVEG